MLNSNSGKPTQKIECLQHQCVISVWHLWILGGPAELVHCVEFLFVWSMGGNWTSGDIMHFFRYLCVVRVILAKNQCIFSLPCRQNVQTELTLTGQTVSVWGQYFYVSDRCPYLLFNWFCFDNICYGTTLVMFKYLFMIIYDNHRVLIVNTSVLLIVKPSQHVNIKLEENSTPNKHIKALLFF